MVSGNQFSWSGNTGVSEASTLGLRPGEVPETLTVKSHKTGRVLNFRWTKTCERGDEVSYNKYTSRMGIDLEVYDD